LHNVSLNTGKCYHIGIILSKCNINIYSSYDELNINADANVNADVNTDNYAFDFARINAESKAISDDDVDEADEVDDDEIGANNEETGIKEIISKITKLFPDINIDCFNAYGRCAHKKSTSSKLISLIRKMTGSLYVSEYNIDFNLSWMFKERPMIQNNTTLYHIFHKYIFPWFINPRIINVTGGCGCQRNRPACYCGAICAYRPASTPILTVTCSQWMYFNMVDDKFDLINKQIKSLTNIDMLIDFILIDTDTEYQAFRKRYMSFYTKPIGAFDVNNLHYLCTKMEIKHHLIDDSKYKLQIERYTEPFDSSNEDHKFYKDAANAANATNNKNYYDQKCINTIMRFGILYGIDKLYYAKLYYKFLHNTTIANNKSFYTIYTSHYFYATAFNNPVTDVQKLYLPKYTQMNYELANNIKLSTSRAFIKRVTDARIALGLDVTDVIIESLVLACVQRDVYCGLFQN
jgi:hypothetical protein